MDAFINIRIKRETAKRFQQFSKTHYKTHTDAMVGILDFFLYNEISPKENFGPTGRRIENSLNKRINAVIAILKDIEKTQTKPTFGILMALLEQAETKKKPLILENNNFRADVPRAPESYNKDRT